MDVQHEKQGHSEVDVIIRGVSMDKRRQYRAGS
jgi:hypothetical protein